MTFSPYISKKDELHSIIYLPEWYYKSKYVRWASHSCFIFGALYLCLLFYHMIARPEKVIMLDLLIGSILIEAMLSTAAIFYEQQTFMQIKQIRENYFWDNSFFNEREKRVFQRETKIAIYAHYMIWVFTLCLFVTLFFVPFLPRFLYGGVWSYWMVKFSFFVYYLTGYYMGNTHEAYYAHIILHGYFQMSTLVVYLRKEFRRYNQMILNKNIELNDYQNEIKRILLRCIKQHQQLTEYGIKIADLYRRWTIFRFLTAITCFSLGFYCFMFDPLSDNIMLIWGIFHFLLAMFLYVAIGELFSSAYDDFRKELLNIEWHWMDENNKELYYMFLIFTQKEFGIEVLPSLYATRPLLTSLLKLVYSGITLLCSVQQSK